MNNQAIKRQLAAAALFAPLAVAWAGGCDRDDQVRVYDVPKRPPGADQVAAAAGPTTGPASAMGDPHGGRSAAELQQMMAAQRAQQGQGQGGMIQWTVPRGWEQLQTQPGDVRHAVFQVTPSLQATVTALGPQETLANVNRWLGQLGSPPITKEQLPQYVKQHDHGGVLVEEVDLTGPAGEKQQRMLAAIVQRPDRYWFIKLVGPVADVAPQQEKFSEFVHSIRFTAGADPTAPQAVQISKYDAPPGWQPQPINAGAMFARELSFKVGEGNGAADLAVTKLKSGATGSIEDNVNRWRGQVGLPPVTQVAESDVQRQTINGLPWLVMDLTGPEAAPGQPAKRMLVAFTEKGGDVWFVKLLGPADVVGGQKPNFTQFLNSLQFGGAGQQGG